MQHTQALAPTPPLAEYAAEMLRNRLERMLSHTEGARSGEATEPIHQMRVWARRTRAALELFHNSASSKDYSEIEHEVKRAAGALGAARDLDVMIQTIASKSTSLPENQRAGITAFIDALSHDRVQMQHPVERAVSRLQRRDLSAMLAKLFSQREHPAAEQEYEGAA